VDLEQSLIVWLTYVSDNVKARVLQRIYNVFRFYVGIKRYMNATAMAFLYATCRKGAFKKWQGI